MEECEDLLLPLDPFDHPDCQVMYWSQQEIRAIKEYTTRCISPILAELETLRELSKSKQGQIEKLEHENEQLDNKLQEQICLVGSLLG